MKDKKNAMQNISKDLVAELQERNIPQIEIARITGKNKGTISKIFNSKSSFTMDDLTAISCELYIPVISIMTKHVYSNLSGDEKKLLKALQNFEINLEENMKTLDNMKKKPGKASS